ncbi:exopolysaccharide biosynthesis polyprenyl glycosylphosphotransferase [Pseudoalteromonas rubra]|uniref:Exopolysaccharide biosynthesis polyprenyl glycosylphosphotransferase n=1 Tax=Pseudoalteromonas rubra TaxID=43658 RepID=A0A5S3V1F2_9GAMM|nr:exopolysaccharide biosynthesis polyprenyl glycosylphosphotransferase [Pseudoalteromonas rubra]
MLKKLPFRSTAFKARNQGTVYLYSPEDRIEVLSKLLEGCGFKVVFNDYTVTSFENKVLCHYESSRLEAKQNLFLVEATEYGAWVEPLVSYLDERNGYTEVDLLHSSYFLHQKSFTILSSKRTQVVKRTLDILFSFFLLVLTIPIALITAILIKLESRGPVLYKQQRTGQYNQEFHVIKFRSMRQDAESNGAQWASKYDSRVTRVGKFIRRTRIDELPQLINVLKGEMSLVGPRPEREVFIKELEKRIPYYRFRHAVKPGVTGLAQTSYRYGESVEDAVWKHKYDIHYIKHHRTLTDLKILLKTVKVVIFGMGQ